MARPRAACGTDAAYRRHLRNGETVDEECQEAHATAVARWREPDPAPEGSNPVAASQTDAEQLRDSARAAVIANVTGTLTAIDDDDLYRVIELTVELDGLVDQWCDAADDLAYSRVYPDLPPELRERLIAARENPEPEPAEDQGYQE